jgi:tetratricopeptide (TPR) repeat protein
VELVAPKKGDGVRAMLESGRIAATDGNAVVVWLDDLEIFVADGVTVDMLREWNKETGVTVAATYGGKGSERVSQQVREGERDELTDLAGLLLSQARLIDMSFTSDAELAQLPAGVPAALRGQIERHGLAAVMVSALALESKLTTQRHFAERESPEGVAVVRAAIDWARCGRTDPISRDRLQNLWPAYLRSGTQETKSFEDGLEWALRPVSGPIALLEAKGSGFVAYDYIVSFAEKQAGVADPKDEAWQAALDTDDLGQAFEVGVRAEAHDREADAMKGMTIARNATDADLSALAAYNLGVMFNRRKDADGAEAAFREADEKGLGDGAANLGVLLEKQGDIEAAEAAYRRADERGHLDGAFNLGVLLDDRGDEVEAEVAYRRADERGHGGAANNLGVLLERRGDLKDAEAAFRRSDERGHDQGARGLGVMLEERGDFDSAEAAYRRADQRGDRGGTLQLGLMLARKGVMDEARRALQRVVESGPSEPAEVAAAALGELPPE